MRMTCLLQKVCALRWQQISDRARRLDQSSRRPRRGENKACPHPERSRGISQLALLQRIRIQRAMLHKLIYGFRRPLGFMNADLVRGAVKDMQRRIG